MVDFPKDSHIWFGGLAFLKIVLAVILVWRFKRKFILNCQIKIGCQMALIHHIICQISCTQTHDTCLHTYFTIDQKADKHTKHAHTHTLYGQNDRQVNSNINKLTHQHTHIQNSLMIDALGLRKVETMAEI